jgi:hypothetical protein
MADSRMMTERDGAVRLSFSKLRGFQSACAFFLDSILIGEESYNALRVPTSSGSRLDGRDRFLVFEHNRKGIDDRSCAGGEILVPRRRAQSRA